MVTSAVSTVSNWLTMVCLWNELPDNIKTADSVQNFKSQLKTLLFRKEFI